MQRNARRIASRAPGCSERNESYSEGEEEGEEGEEGGGEEETRMLRRRTRGNHLSGQVTSSKRTVIFWGAGATAAFGMRLTDAQSGFILRLADTESGLKSSPLRKRVQKALKGADEEPWTSAFEDLLTILGDQSEEKGAGIASVDSSQMDAMRRNLSLHASEDDVRNRIVTLRTLYDWRALRAVVSGCPGSRENGGSGFKIADLFNVLDMHEHAGHGFPVEGDDF